VMHYYPKSPNIQLQAAACRIPINTMTGNLSSFTDFEIHQQHHLPSPEMHFSVLHLNTGKKEPDLFLNHTLKDEDLPRQTGQQLVNM
jgi:hypothetical protein